jgi:hypothetical protein
MNKIASRIEAALTLTDKTLSDVRKQPVTSPDDVYRRQRIVYELECAIKFIRDAYFEQVAMP